MGGNGENHGRSARQTTRLPSRQSEPLAYCRGRLPALYLAIGADHLEEERRPRLWNQGPLDFAASARRRAVTMFGWWRDVIKEAHEGYETPVVQLAAALRHDPVHRLRGDVLRRLVLGLFRRRALSQRGDHLAPIRVLGGQWPPGAERRHDIAAGIGSFEHTFDPWGLPLVNTLILLTSGTTVTWAHHSLLKATAEDSCSAFCTVMLGILFTTCQAYEYTHAGFGFANHIYGSTFFMATGFHGFHVIVGTIFLTVMPDPGHARRLHAEAAFRLRGRRLVLAFRRRGVAVPVHLHLCVGRRTDVRCGLRRIVFRPAKREPGSQDARRFNQLRSG